MKTQIKRTRLAPAKAAVITPAPDAPTRRVDAKELVAVLTRAMQEKRKVTLTNFIWRGKECTHKYKGKARVIKYMFSGWFALADTEGANEYVANEFTDRMTMSGDTIFTMRNDVASLTYRIEGAA